MRDYATSILSEKECIHMIKLVMGLKGTGKTKELISTVNSVAKTAEGSVICLERDDKLRYETRK